MTSLLKFALIGGGAYLLYESGILSSLTGGAIASPSSTTQPAPPATPAPASSTSSPSTVPPQSTASPAPAPPAAVPTWQRVLDAAGGGNPAQTFDQWNYFFQQVTGTPGPDPVPFVGAAGSDSRNQNLQVAQWWNFIQQWKPGLQGISGFRRAPYFAAAPPRNPRAQMPVHPLDPWGGRFN